jgi:hypothetical protein
VLPAKLTSVLCAVVASVGAARVARALELGLAAELAAGLAIAVDPALAFAQVSGMEVMLASALALWAVGELAADRPGPAAVAAALAPLARPEMLVLALPVLGVIEWRLHRRGARPATRVLVLVPLLVGVGGWMLYCLLVSGHPLPSTYYAKFAGKTEFFSHNVALVVGQVLPGWPWFVRGTGFVLWALGAFIMLRRGPAGALAAAFPVVYLLAASGSQYVPQAWPFYWQRYLLPALPFFLLGISVGSVHVVRWAWQRRRQAWAPARALVALLLLLGSLVALPSAWRSSTELYAWNCQNIEELNVAMANWLRDNVPAHETIAVNDAGAARYFGPHRVLDLMGLNHHGLLHREPEALAEIGRVRVLSVFPSWFPSVADRASFTAIHRTATANLTICRCPQSEIVAYRRDSAGL